MGKTFPWSAHIGPKPGNSKPCYFSNVELNHVGRNKIVVWAIWHEKCTAPSGVLIERFAVLVPDSSRWELRRSGKREPAVFRTGTSGCPIDPGKTNWAPFE